MRQYEPCIQKDKIKNEGKTVETGGRENGEREIFFYFFFLRFSLRSTEIGP